MQLAREGQRAVCDVVGRLGFCQAALRVDDLGIESAITALHGVAGQSYVDTSRETFGRAEIVDQSQLRWIYGTTFKRDCGSILNTAFASSCDARLVVKDFGRVDFFQRLSEARHCERTLQCIGEYSRWDMINAPTRGGFPQQVAGNVLRLRDSLCKQIFRPHQTLIGHGVTVIWLLLAP